MTNTRLLTQITPPYLRELHKLAKQRNVTDARMVELLIEQARKRESEASQARESK